MNTCNRCGHDIAAYAPMYDANGQRLCGFCQAPLAEGEPPPFVKQQDDVVAALDAWPKSKRLQAHQYLYAQGIRISGISYEMRKAFNDEQK